MTVATKRARSPPMPATRSERPLEAQSVDGPEGNPVTEADALLAAYVGLCPWLQLHNARVSHSRAMTEVARNASAWRNVCECGHRTVRRDLYCGACHRPLYPGGES